MRTSLYQSYSDLSEITSYSLSLAAKRQSSSLTREPALSVAPRHLSQRERQVKSCETKAFLSEEGGAAQAATEGAAHEQVCLELPLICRACGSHRLLGSPFGRAGICKAND